MTRILMFGRVGLLCSYDLQSPAPEKNEINKHYNTDLRCIYEKYKNAEYKHISAPDIIS